MRRYIRDLSRMLEVAKSLERNKDPSWQKLERVDQLYQGLCEGKGHLGWYLCGFGRFEEELDEMRGAVIAKRDFIAGGLLPPQKTIVREGEVVAEPEEIIFNLVPYLKGYLGSFEESRVLRLNDAYQRGVHEEDPVYRKLEETSEFFDENIQTKFSSWSSVCPGLTKYIDEARKRILTRSMDKKEYRLLLDSSPEEITEQQVPGALEEVARIEKSA